MAADIFEKFKKSMEVKFAQEFGSNKQTGGDITSNTTKFLRLGPEQDDRKVEMIKAGKRPCILQPNDALWCSPRSACNHSLHHLRY